MKNKKILKSLVILSIGVLASIFIINQDSNAVSKTTIESNNSSESSLSFLSNNNNERSDLITSSPNNLTAYENDDEVTNNLTDLLANSFSGNIVSGEDPKSIDIESFIQERGLENYMEEAEFSLNDIIISSDDSKNNHLRYLERIREIAINNFSGFEGEALEMLQAHIERGDSEKIEKIVSLIPKFIDDMLLVKAPESMKEAHLTVINVWSKKLFIYKSILNMENDPLKAYLAMEHFIKVAEEDVAIQSTLLNYYEELTQ
ncbi:MAG: hypothetical protein WDZ80_04895 [Candidatus Paceibacterota bacterium]